MTTQLLIRLLREVAFWSKTDFDPEELRRVETNQRVYTADEFHECKRDLAEAARKMNLAVIEQTIRRDQLERFIKGSKEAMAVFRFSGTDIEVELLVSDNGRIRSLLNSEAGWNLSTWTSTGQDVRMLVFMPYQGIVSDFNQQHSPIIPLSPVKRFFRLLGTEKKEITYVLVYALFIGLLTLVLPLGLQNLIELISGGVFFSSVYVLIFLVIFGLLFIGILQMIQISMVEHLQRRIFVKAAFEFAFRIPRIRVEALRNSYAPELINRFFDIITIQKGLPKILLDLSGAAIQIFFGLLLLSLYHPFFVFFSLFLVGLLVIMFYFTAPRGLDSSIHESKYKYKVVHWLEELARAINSFKLAGNTELPIRKTDQATSNYIKYRKKHFSVLLTQFSFFVFFKVAIAGGLLVVGTMLVVDRQITLGQFVAAEVVIVLVLNAVEKIMLHLDVLYDMFTAVDKVSHVTDLPIERSGGFDLQVNAPRGHRMEATDLYYRYPDAVQPVLKKVNLVIEPGERLCIAGPGGSGKTTLTNILAGLYNDYNGAVSVNNVSLRDLDVTNMRDRVAKNIAPEDIFEGTIYENITIGKPTATLERTLEAIDGVGLREFVNSLPDGLNTQIVSGGKGLSSSTIHRLILARCLAKDPALIILNDFFSGLSKADKLEFIQCVVNPARPWTLIAISNDPLVMASCDRVIVMSEGEIVADDSFENLSKQGVIAKYLE